MLSHILHYWLVVLLVFGLLMILLLLSLRLLHHHLDLMGGREGGLDALLVVLVGEAASDKAATSTSDTLAMNGCFNPLEGFPEALIIDAVVRVEMLVGSLRVVLSQVFYAFIVFRFIHSSIFCCHRSRFLKNLGSLRPW